MTIEAQFGDYKEAAGSWWREHGRHWPHEHQVRYAWGGQGCVYTGNDERVQARCHLESSQHLYEADQNPLVAWMAILDARSAGVEIPRWVRGYLERAAAALLGIAHERVPRASRTARLAEALGFRSRGAGRKRDAFDGFVEPMPGFDLAFDLWMARASMTHEEARHQLATKRGISERTIDRAWARWRGAVVPKHLQRARNRP